MPEEVSDLLVYEPDLRIVALHQLVHRAGSSYRAPAAVKHVRPIRVEVVNEHEERLSRQPSGEAVQYRVPDVLTPADASLATAGTAFR